MIRNVIDGFCIEEGKASMLVCIGPYEGRDNMLQINTEPRKFFECSREDAIALADWILRSYGYP